MALEPENLVLIHLRRLEKADGLRDSLREITERLGSLERQVAGVRGDIADLRSDFVRLEAVSTVSSEDGAYREAT